MLSIMSSGWRSIAGVQRKLPALLSCEGCCLWRIVQEALKLQMAAAAQQLLQNPQDHLKNLSALLALTTDSHPEVRPCLRQIHAALASDEGWVLPDELYFRRQLAPLQPCSPYADCCGLPSPFFVTVRANFPRKAEADNSRLMQRSRIICVMITASLNPFRSWWEWKHAQDHRSESRSDSGWPHRARACWQVYPLNRSRL